MLLQVFGKTNQSSVVHVSSLTLARKMSPFCKLFLSPLYFLYISFSSSVGWYLGVSECVCTCVGSQSVTFHCDDPYHIHINITTYTQTTQMHTHTLTLSLSLSHTHTHTHLLRAMMWSRPSSDVSVTTLSCLSSVLVSSTRG